MFLTSHFSIMTPPRCLELSPNGAISIRQPQCSVNILSYGVGIHTLNTRWSSKLVNELKLEQSQSAYCVFSLFSTSLRAVFYLLLFRHGCIPQWWFYSHSHLYCFCGDLGWTFIVFPCPMSWIVSGSGWSIQRKPIHLGSFATRMSMEITSTSDHMSLHFS